MRPSWHNPRYEITPVVDKQGEKRPGIFVAQGEQRIIEWAPQPGSQQAFLSCPVQEVLYEGTRGGGKTDCLIMDFCQDVGRGLGMDWRGILFRETYPQLQDVIAKSLKWIPKMWPEATYNRSEYTWTWKTGEQLLLRHMKTEEDYLSYHGHSYQWIGWEELTNWPDSKVYTAMFSTLRSSNKKAKLRVRATCNPSGPGHNWVKQRWRLPISGRKIVGTVIKGDYIAEFDLKMPDRIAIHSDVRENLILLSADPGYPARIAASARSDAERRAWLYGAWDIVAGGMFDDVWDYRHHIIPAFPLSDLPATWKINRAYDHGQSKPFSVGWYAESDGNPLILDDGRAVGEVKGDIIRIGEWYGWSGSANEGVRMLSRDIAKRIVAWQRENLPGRVVKAGPADSAIYDKHEGEKSVAGEMAKEGVRWVPVTKGPNSRSQGWEIMRKYLRGAIPDSEGFRETPGLFALDTCPHFIRTVPTLPRDKHNSDDVDTNAEDHVADEVRYRCRGRIKSTKSSYSGMVY